MNYWTLKMALKTTKKLYMAIMGANFWKEVQSLHGM